MGSDSDSHPYLRLDGRKPAAKAFILKIACPPSFSDAGDVKTNTPLPTLGAIALLLTGTTLAVHAQAPATVKQVPLDPIPAATAVFSAELGRAVVKPNPALNVTYSVTATEPATSKAVSQKLRFNILEEGLRQVTDASGQTGERQGTSSRYLTLNTGKYKNIGQLKALMADVLRRFLAAGPGCRDQRRSRQSR